MSQNHYQLISQLFRRIYGFIQHLKLYIAKNPTLLKIKRHLQNYQNHQKHQNQKFLKALLQNKSNFSTKSISLIQSTLPKKIITLCWKSINPIMIITFQLKILKKYKLSSIFSTTLRKIKAKSVKFRSNRLANKLKNWRTERKIKNWRAERKIKNWRAERKKISSKNNQSMPQIKKSSSVSSFTTPFYKMEVFTWTVELLL